ncbi:MAG: hypothetical protein LBL90_11520 [Prevotellaceae bacterium]|jgi:IS5 family transposase|nr:hypothetical protein [Prevotellaceae bacterium]
MSHDKTTEKRESEEFVFDMDDMLDNKLPLYLLANKIDWQHFETAFIPLYSKDKGMPAKPIRLMFACC